MRDVHNLADLVRRGAAAGGGRPALRWQDQVLSWAELDSQVEAVAGALWRLAASADPGAADAARVAIVLPNVPEFAAAFFGTLRAGLVAVPINPGYTGRELRHVLNDAGASVLIATPAVFAALGTAGLDGPGTTAPTLAKYSVSGPAEGARPFLDLLATGRGSAPEVTSGGEDLAVLLYTSGTEGLPKGAMLAHRALLANHAQLARLDPAPVGRDDVLLLAVPLFHAYGLNSGLCAVAYHGACGVLAERFDPADALELISRHAVTAIVGVPPMIVAWSLLDDSVTNQFARVRIVVSGAAPLAAAAARRFTAVTGQVVHEGYGLTETAPVLTSTLASPHAKPGSIGRAIPGVEIKLVDAAGGEIPLTDDADDHGSGSPGTDPGEIVVRGANLFSGYWPDAKGGPDAEGWWATGDVAYADGDGDLFLVDRLGELILVSGFNVYPHEVEAVLRAHPAVRDAAALGVPHPYTGQTVKAYVVREPGAQVAAEEIIASCERNLARFKCPTSVEFVAALPYSATGKIRKAALRGSTNPEAL